MTDMIESTELLAFKWQKDGYEVTVKISFWIVLSWDELKVRQNLPYFTKFLGLHTENSGIHFSNAHKNNKKIRKKREKLKKTDKKFKIRTRTNKRLKVTEDNKWVNWYHLHNMAGGHVFCAPRNLCVFLFTYLSFTTLLNVDCSWSIFSTPGKILYTSQQLSMPIIPSEGASKLKSAGSSRSRHNLVKVHLGLTLMLNSTYSMMMICLSDDVSLNPGPTGAQSTNLPTIRRAEALKFPISTSAALRTSWIPFAFSSKTILWISSQFPKLGWVLK